MGFPNGADVGFQWVTDGLFYFASIGFPKMGPHGLYEGYPYVGCIGYVNVGHTRAFCGLLNWICNGFPTRAQHWLPKWAWSW